MGENRRSEQEIAAIQGMVSPLGFETQDPRLKRALLDLLQPVATRRRKVKIACNHGISSSMT